MMCSLAQAQTNLPMLCALSNSSHDTQQCLGGAASAGTSLLWWYPAISKDMASETGMSMDEQPEHILEDMKDWKILPHWTVCHYRTSSWWPPPHWCVCHGPKVERYETRGGKLEGLFSYFVQNNFFRSLCNTVLPSSFTSVFVNLFIHEFLLSPFIKQAYSSTTCMSDLGLYNFTFYTFS